MKQNNNNNKKQQQQQQQQQQALNYCAIITHWQFSFVSKIIFCQCNS